MESPGHSALNHGHLREGKWYCECGFPARCNTTKKSGPNTGRKFWRCTNSERQCDFFLWVDHEEGVREWIKMSQTQPAPETPTRTETFTGAADTSPQQLQTPFTKAKRKEPSRSVLIDLEAESSTHRGPDNDGDPFQTQAAAESRDTSGHARKASRTSITSTPGQTFVERLQSCTLPLPTPSTRDQHSSSDRLASRPRTAHRRDGSPTPLGFHDMTEPYRGTESDLTAMVLDLVRADHPNIKDSTEMQIRHEIGLVLDVGDTKIRRHERTIAELLKKINELEANIIVSSLP